MMTSAPAPRAFVSIGTASASSPRTRRPGACSDATSASPPASCGSPATALGKPILASRSASAEGATSAEGPVTFNLTHSGAVGYLAIATCSVGIDVELHRPFDDLQPLIDNYCSTAEIAALSGLPPGSRAAGFLAVWTRKEAALKAWGTGIGAVPLDALHVGLAQGGAAAGRESLPGLVRDGITYPGLRLLTIGGDDEVLSIAAAGSQPLAVRMAGEEAGADGGCSGARRG